MNSKIENLKIGDLCLLGNLSNYLYINGFHYQEHQLGGIIGAYGAYYNVECQEYTGLCGSFKMVFDRFKNTFEYGLKEASVTYGQNAFLMNLEKLIHKVGPVLLWIDQYYLPGSTHFKSDHFSSIVILLKIDMNQVYIYDNAYQELKVEDFIKAIENQNDRTLYYCIREKHNSFKNINQNIEMIKTLSTNMKENIHWNYGFGSLENMYERVMYETSNDFMLKCYYQIHKPGGLKQTRNSMRLFLTNYQNHLPGIDTLCEIYERAYYYWGLTGNLFYRMNHNMLSENRKSIIEKLKMAISLEKKAIDYIDIHYGERKYEL